MDATQGFVSLCEPSLNLSSYQLDDTIVTLSGYHFKLVYSTKWMNTESLKINIAQNYQMTGFLTEGQV